MGVRHFSLSSGLLLTGQDGAPRRRCGRPDGGDRCRTSEVGKEVLRQGLWVVSGDWDGLGSGRVVMLQKNGAVPEAVPLGTVVEDFAARGT